MEALDVGRPTVGDPTVGSPIPTTEIRLASRKDAKLSRFRFRLGNILIRAASRDGQDSKDPPSNGHRSPQFVGVRTHHDRIIHLIQTGRPEIAIELLDIRGCLGT